jgi:hypothetical protein
MGTKPFQKALILTLLFTILLAPRLMGIKKFTTGDEPAWLIFSHNFLHAIHRGQFERTVYEYHPAVTTMWVITASILSYFPEYTQIRHGYIEKFWDLDEIYAKNGKALSTVLYRSRALYVLLTSIFLLLSFFLLWRLAGIAMALAAILLVSFDPFFLGQSRLLNHEGLACALALAAFLALLVYLYQGRKLLYLLISATLCGLALLTKSPMILLLPLAGLMFAVRLVEDWQKVADRRNSLWKAVAGYIGWLAVLALVYVALWPGMWVAPGKMLYEIYGNAFSYAFQGSRLQVTGEVVIKPIGFNFSDLGNLLVSLLYKTTPIVWLGAALSIASLFDHRHAPTSKLAKLVVIYLALLALLFILMFGIAQGRNSIHYILMVFVSLDVLAGVGYVWGANLLAAKFAWAKNKAVQASLISCVILAQCLSGLPDYPYYYTYTNPLVQALQSGAQDPAAGYGEGLELAAAYLAKKPDARELIVSSHLGVGSFSYYFPGTSYPLMYQSREYLTDRSAGWFRQSDYLVIYDIQQRAMDLPVKLLDALEGVTPEHVIDLNGLRYASIYKISDLPERVFDALLPPG